MLNLPEINKANIAKEINANKSLVVCLCAQWCNNCEEWKKEFSLLAQNNSESCFVWLDIDEHADMVAEIDLDILPVLVIYKNEHISFVGPVRPDKTVILTLMSASAAGEAFDDPGIRDFLLE